MGLLRIKGSIDITQFWPTGKSPNILSDADTVHVQVDPKSSFVFEGNVTRAFDFAWITTGKDKDGSRSPNYVMVRVSGRRMRTLRFAFKGSMPPSFTIALTRRNRKSVRTGASELPSNSVISSSPVPRG